MKAAALTDLFNVSAPLGFGLGICLSNRSPCFCEKAGESKCQLAWALPRRKHLLWWAKCCSVVWCCPSKSNGLRKCLLRPYATTWRTLQLWTTTLPPSQRWTPLDVIHCLQSQWGRWGLKASPQTIWQLDPKKTMACSWSVPFCRHEDAATWRTKMGQSKRWLKQKEECRGPCCLLLGHVSAINHPW